MLGVLVTKEGLLYWHAPINAEGIILNADTTIVCWSIVVVALILEDSGLRKDGEAMGEATGDEELAASPNPSQGWGFY